ncbi:BRI3-like protein [Mya arenaria]|uniref:Membrane protein BRI3 n=1 Tax=Mya arenaria TaxID=6604 RepID=A0ABY7DFH6_MYAAR|nr:BRI3-like protein [Mya arenaria]
MSAQPIPVVTSAPTTTTFIVGGGCSKCGVGHLESSYTKCGILMAICFFPIGVICCVMMKEKKCGRCGASF